MEVGRLRLSGNILVHWHQLHPLVDAADYDRPKPIQFLPLEIRLRLELLEQIKRDASEKGIVRPGDEPLENDAEEEIIDVSDYEAKRIPSRTWRECIKKIGEVAPLDCPKCARSRAFKPRRDEDNKFYNRGFGNTADTRASEFLGGEVNTGPAWMGADIWR